MADTLRKVLVVTYYFPPSGGAGVQRVLKFIKYLREFGWEPVVLTVDNADYPAYDETLFAEIPEGLRVYRSSIFEPYRLYRRFTGKKADASTDIATLSLDQENRQRWSERVSEWIRASFFVPDARVGWLYFAVRLGKKVIEKENIEVIFSSSPPYTTNLVGRFLRTASGLPWVADFRDSWIGWVSSPKWRPRMSGTLEMKMEGTVLRHASRIITTTAAIKEDLLSRHPGNRDERWCLISNGYDAGDFDALPELAGVIDQEDDRMTITYSGSLYGARNPESLLLALESMQKEQPELVKKLRFCFVGRIGEPILQRIEESGVAGLFEIVSYVTHSESIAYLLAADISLLIVDESPKQHAIIPGKVYEYIGAGKPILALAPEGESADLVRENDLGVVVHPKDVEGIKDALCDLLKRHKNAAPGRKPSLHAVSRFERREQTRQLAQVLDKVVDER